MFLISVAYEENDHRLVTCSSWEELWMHPQGVMGRDNSLKLSRGIWHVGCCRQCPCRLCGAKTLSSPALTLSASPYPGAGPTRRLLTSVLKAVWTGGLPPLSHSSSQPQSGPLSPESGGGVETKRFPGAVGGAAGPELSLPISVLSETWEYITIVHVTMFHIFTQSNEICPVEATKLNWLLNLKFGHIYYFLPPNYKKSQLP